MDQFLNLYGDLTALMLTVFSALILTIFQKRKTGKTTRALSLYFLFFGPSGILVFMFFHLLENSYRAVLAGMEGTFVYNFRFYSLIMLGLVMMLIGFSFLKACLRRSQEENGNRAVLFAISLVTIVSVPLIPITSISVFPLVLCAVSLAGLPFATRRVNNSAVVPFAKNRATGS